MGSAIPASLKNGIRAKKEWDPMGSAIFASPKNGIRGFPLEQAPRQKNFRPGDGHFAIIKIKGPPGVARITKHFL